MPYLTREQILATEDIQREEVSVPEWGGTVLVRGLTGAERDRYEASLISMKGSSASLKLENARARLVAIGVIDENGNRVFTTKDVEALGAKSGHALERVADVIQRLSGLSGADLSQLTQNFTIDQNGGSTSD